MSFIGIMQGRLSPRPFPRLQAFPWASWEQEFWLAKECKLDSIEWLFESEKYQENPVWSLEGRAKIASLVKQTGVSVQTLCADYFMDHPFFRVPDQERRASIEILQELIEKASKIGIKAILIPVLEVSEIRSIEDRDCLVLALGECVQQAKEFNVKLGLETELPGQEYFNLIRSFNSDYIGAYYDAGNTAYCGFNMREDMEILKEVLVGVHIKDRKKGGESVPIGTGDANFLEGIPFLKKQGFRGGFILQHYFEEDQIEAAKQSLKFVNTLMA
ncbi:sugar phosphate isomerase/epimerase [Desulfosporosinus fructosivorans]|uniref:Sugar phosphate isomerase/epimerase n=1 Tax=Desulfosporosinus fructosivorans TaxID=2018669 RepID=A0A4Z0QYN2_9FIRM|nr:sugar phosphate isomerase/epimerase family protein [Desulfosporosinus fructosivorans]TGE35389.1 sugar phosphate isomerase/epimerase [Desulfosporosinus fructosivorans]